ncbi:MAG: type II secretion system F family protein [Desulfuromonadales bacterium]
MSTFQCKIGTADGRVVEREFEAASRELLRDSLEEQGFSVFRISRRPMQSLLGVGVFQCRFSGRRFLSFNQEMLVLIRSGMPILKILDTLIERMEAGRMLEVLREIRQDIKGGGSLSEAFSKFPHLFSHLYIASIKAGERTGDLPVTLARFIAYQKRVEAIRAKVRSASFYPILLTLAVLAVLLFLLLYVIPTFTQIYADANVTLPVATRVLIWLSGSLTSLIPVLLPLLVAVFVLGRTFFLTEKGGLLLDHSKLQIPFFGPLQIEYALTGFSRTFGTTLASGIPIIQAMQMSRGTLNNRILEGKILQAVRRVEEGSSLSDALEQAGFFPLIALRMIGVGESTGALSDMLGEVAEYYEAEVARRLDRLTTLIEPLLMVGMGLLIGGIVVAMYIPIFQLAGTASR